MAVITVQSKSGVCFTTPSSVHNLFKTHDIVKEHKQKVKMKSSELQLGLIHVTNYGAKRQSLMRWCFAAFFQTAIFYFIFFYFCLKIPDAADRPSVTPHGLRCGANPASILRFSVCYCVSTT